MKTLLCLNHRRVGICDFFGNAGRVNLHQCGTCVNLNHYATIFHKTNFNFTLGYGLFHND